MKILFSKQSFVLCVIVIFVSLFLLFFFQYQTYFKKETLQQQPITTTIPGLPVRLIIPVIGVDAMIQHVGLTPDGDMEVPNNIIDVGWFRFGSRPGEKGSAVISGHMNGQLGETGVFAPLSKLKKGDIGTITDDKGNIFTFMVQESRVYDAGYAEEVFSTNDKAYLNLITCDGDWNETKASYTKRLVVFTVIIH